MTEEQQQALEKSLKEGYYQSDIDRKEWQEVGDYLYDVVGTLGRLPFTSNTGDDFNIDLEKLECLPGNAVRMTLRVQFPQPEGAP